MLGAVDLSDLLPNVGCDAGRTLSGAYGTGQQGVPALMPLLRWRSRTWQMMASTSASGTSGIAGMSPNSQWWEVTPFLTALRNEKSG